ncbi:MAG: glutathione peroxidase [Chitinophagaceae bacterium]
MTFRQKILKLVYPLLMKSRSKHALIKVNLNQFHPVKSFYNLTITCANSQIIDTETLRGKKILIVNTASNCGYTAQYKELQQLHEQLKHQLTIIGFPSNDFKQQEKLGDVHIAAFCQTYYGVTFPLAQKSVVVKSEKQHEVFRWLTNANINGWNDRPPVWNFCKYLINETGELTHVFGPAVSPMSDAFLKTANLK